MIGQEPCMKKVWEGTHAFLSYRVVLRFVRARDFTDNFGHSHLYIAKKDAFPGGYGTAFPKGSPYLKRFDRYFQQLTEAGFIAKWTNEILKGAKKYPRVTEVNLEKSRDEGTSGPIPLSFQHLKAAFYLCAIMLAASLVAFITEILFYSASRGRDSKN